MSQVIVMPDGQKVRFGDDFTSEEIKALIESKYPEFAAEQRAKAGASDYSKSHVGQGVYGLNEGIGNALGFPVDAMNGLLRAGDAGLTALGANVIPDLPENAFGGSQMIKDAMSGVGSIKPPTGDPVKDALRRVGQEVGAGLVPGLGIAGRSATPVRSLLESTTTSLGSGAGAVVANAVAPGNPLAEMTGQLLGGLGPSGIAGALRNRATALEAPTVGNLEDEAGALYDAAEANGTVFPAARVNTVAHEIASEALSEGLDQTLHPGATAALQRLMAVAQNPLTVADARTLRRVIAASGKSFTNPDEQRIGSIMLRRFDDFLNQGAPELREANALYTRAKRGELIETAIELAGSRAGQFSGSGFENALRTEFRNLERQIIKGKLHVTQAESEAISRVAQGGPMENVARWMGKFAPTGAVSFAAGAGVPFAVGNTFGGPLAGALAAGTVMGTGLAGRSAATALTNQNAQIARALALRGGAPTRTPLFSDEQRAIVAALLAANENGAQKVIPQLTVGTKGAPQYQFGGN